MCGIAGYIALDGGVVPRDAIEPMLVSLRHRGPDGFGVYIGESCVLGHARLSIIDLEGGWQPIFNENGNLAVTFNGEIYNYVELRKELESKGHIFYTKSDTEVIIHSYEEWGVDCAKHFNGQFAFAIHDASNRSLFLCRDRMGVRPLYYTHTGSLFVFASEIKAIFASSYCTPKVYPDGINQIFTLWTNVFPYTPFAGVMELPPAHTMMVSDGRITLSRYWEYPIDEDKSPRSVEEYQEEILFRLNESVRLRLRADVPVGAYLSGGLDSALTTTLIKMWTDAPLKTFSVEFEDSRFDESEYQAEMVRHLNTEHSSIRCKPDDIVLGFEQVIRSAERPVLRTAPVPMLLLSKLVRSEGYKVVITGEGADEFLLGYDIFKESKVREFCSRKPESKLRPHLLRRLYPYLFNEPRMSRFQEAFFLQRFQETTDPFYGHQLRWNLCRRIHDFYTPEFVELLEGDPVTVLLDALPDCYSSLQPGKRTQLAEIETLLSGYLLSSQGDRVGMANSVEGRYIFLDHNVIESAARIPHRIKMPGLQEKSLLKRIGRSLLPEKILRRKKFPYRAPDIESFFFSSTGRMLLSEAMDPARMGKSGIFDCTKVLDLMKQAMGTRQGKLTTSDNLVLMAALSTSLLHKIFFDAPTEKKSFGPSDCVRWAREGEGRCLKAM